VCPSSPPAACRAHLLCPAPLLLPLLLCDGRLLGGCPGQLSLHRLLAPGGGLVRLSRQHSTHVPLAVSAAGSQGGRWVHTATQRHSLLVVRGQQRERQAPACLLLVELPLPLLAQLLLQPLLLLVLGYLQRRPEASAG
jgi:hypothetical protein